MSLGTPEKEEMWMLPITFVIRRKDAINAFEVFQQEVVEPLIRILGDNDNIIFLFDHSDMVKHVHTEESCQQTPISREDQQLILKLTLPIELLNKMEERKKKVEGMRTKLGQAIACTRCQGKGKIREGTPPIVEIRKCPDCDGKGYK